MIERTYPPWLWKLRSVTWWVAKCIVTSIVLGNTLFFLGNCLEFSFKLFPEVSLGYKRKFLKIWTTGEIITAKSKLYHP